MRWVCRVVVLLLPACFHPVYDHPACGLHGECPSGLQCSVQGFCERPGSGPVGDGTGIDALGMANDAHVADAVPPDASLCGDGQAETSLGEVCDDGNASACGTCSADCRTAISPAAATGEIVVAAAVGTNVMDGDTFMLGDGFFATDKFEFDNDGNVSAGNIAISFVVGESASDLTATMQQVFITVLDSHRGAIMISGGSGGIFTLTNARASSLGNQPFNPTGGIATSFTFIGMSGGRAGDCPKGTGCKTGDDCTSGVCNSMGRCN